MAHEMDEREGSPRRRGRFRAIGAELPKIVRPVLGKRGLGEAQLLLHWATIVGPELADDIRPERLTFQRGERTHGTLKLRVSPAAALELQHQAPIILERINTFLGYPAVARLTYVQVPLPPTRPRPKEPRPLLPQEEKALRKRVSEVDDEELRAALEKLGAAVIRTRSA